MDVILSKEDRNNGLDIPPQTPDVSHQTGQENQNRNLNGSQNISGTSAPSSQNEVNGTASELLSSANNMEEKKKDQRKGNYLCVSSQLLQSIREKKVKKKHEKSNQSTFTILKVCYKLKE